MVNKEILKTLFSMCLEKAENKAFVFDIPSNHLDDVLVLLRATHASWEITSVYGVSSDEYITIAVTEF